GKSLEQDLQQSRGQSASKNKSDSWTCMSGETGSLHCQSIIYTEFPSQDLNRAKAKDGSANSVESGSAFSAWYCPGVPALVDVLVNTTNPKLDLDFGYVSKTILKIAGKGIQTECYKKYQSICVGDVAVTSAGNFPHVQNIVHVVLPTWRPTGNFSLMVLELLVTKCLIETDKRRLQSIAFPVLGTGKLLYPTHLVAKTMCDTISKYGRNRKTNIKTVKVAIFERDILKIFKYYEQYKSLGYGKTDGGDNSGKQTKSCTIEVHGLNKQTSDDTVELYFESKRAAGQPVDIEKFDTSRRKNNGVVFITYKTAEVAQLVLERQHTLEKSPLTVRLFKGSEPVPSQFYQKKIFFKNMNQTTTRKGLKSFLRSKIQVSPTEFLFGKEDGTVLVTFDVAPDFEKVEQACQKSSLDDCVLEVKRVPVSLSILVSGVSEKTTLSTLEFYFENTRRSGGGDVTDVKEISDRTFVISFEDYTVMDRVCERSHVVDGCRLAVQIYYEMLGYRHSYTQPTLKVPSPVELTDVDPNEIQCIKATDTTELEKQLGNQHAKLHWPENVTGHLKLECVITEDIEDSHRLVLSWEKVVKDILRRFLAQVEITRAQVVIPKLQQTSVDVTGSGKASSLKIVETTEADVKPSILQDSSDNITVDDKRERFKHFKHSQDDLEHVADINIGMSEEIFLALQFFCRSETIMNQQSFGYKNGMLQINCTDKREKKNLETCIKSKLQHIEKLNKDDVSFTSTEEPKIKGTISGINHDVDGVFCYQLKEDEHMTVHIMAHSYGQLQTAKHKIFLGIGRIRRSETRRRFDNTSLQQNKENTTLSERNRFSQSYHRSPTWQTPPNLDYGSVVSKDFTTAEGLLVRVYSGNILHLDVDCIVNAANGDLQHGGGVARVISSAAGYEFDKESRDYIARYGPLKVGEVCTTTAGDLKYKGVIHAVGPSWYDYGQDQKRECLHDLKTAVKNSLEEADIQSYKSIAIPAISSGIFGVPKEHRALQYYRAVEEYSRTRGRHSTLTEVHFIVEDTQMCQLIQTTFTKCFSLDPGAASGGRHKFTSSVMAPRQNAPVLQRSNSLPSNTEGSSVDPSNLSPKGSTKKLQRSTSSGQCFEIGSNLTVHIINGNIVDIKADAIVSPENIQCDSTGRIAREITRVAGEGYVVNDQSELSLRHRKPKLTEVVDTLAGKSHFKYVLHVVAPKWDVDAVDDQRTYWKCLEQSYNNVFSTVDTKHLPVSSIALPILGNGTVPKHPAPIITISKLLVEICKSYADKTPTKKTLYFCSDDSADVYHLKGVFEKYFNKRNESKEDNRGQREDQKEQTVHDVTGQDQGSEVTEDCCICMDTMTKPKKLSCGHVFCTECIDQQFKYWPACPLCEAVHGKIMGDQPPGTMTINTTKSYRGHGYLPGYSGCGIINITYNFPSGKQGTDHPTPGKLYQGITRPAYLPNNEKGRLVAKLLKIAFDRKLVFTIGRSRTTGHEGVVTWNGIHHKTRIDGGPQAFGYPDPTYLDRALQELAAQGVTEESLNDP
ncbi:LOW QUALITY PROTEIN: uncharacterized protein LOC117321077, partial [Pecten maximus]|uniref:LOW QUALITY PROTEIN: uncharacterized protein LOC117321077 n=1 Tax=Pecten maximus TaxID=6579 RepID=UPI0014583B07